MIEQAEESPRVLDMRLDYFFPRELLDRFTSAGFDSVELHGNFGSEPFDPARHDVVVYEATKPRATNLDTT